MTLLITIILQFITYFLRGLAFSTMWGWFVVPFGLPTISIAWAVGLVVIILLPTTNINLSDLLDRSPISIGQLCIIYVYENFITLLLFGIGYIAHINM